MAKTAKSAKAPKDDLADLSFEEALKQLESIVDAMETDELALEQLMKQYEVGMRLQKICAEKLSEAELRIQQLEKNNKGELSLKPVTLDGNDE